VLMTKGRKQMLIYFFKYIVIFHANQ
jgi:hypothetical protein